MKTIATQRSFISEMSQETAKNARMESENNTLPFFAINPLGVSRFRPPFIYMFLAWQDIAISLGILLAIGGSSVMAFWKFFR
ncbi:MAG: hypothetical protein IPN90_03085 [Elusimicrobia bacterium]|nr:hypothetical protein [Elusimicrobiota bacterium]